MMKDFFFNGQAHGNVAGALMNADFNPGVLRPYFNKQGVPCVDIHQNGKLVSVPMRNADTTLRYDEWKLIDDAVIKAARPRLKAVADLRGRGLTYSIPNGMSKTVLSTERMSDPGSAVVSMDGLREGANDRPVFDIVNLPLPIIHSDFSISSRQLAVSRNGNTPFDTTMSEACGRRVAEEAEKMLLGNSTVADQYAYGGGTIYGYTDFPSALTYTPTLPTDSAWTGDTFITDLLAMRQSLYNNYHYGPYMIYVSPGWDRYIDDDYKAASDKTIRNRALEINGFEGITTLDYLGNYKILMVEMTSQNVREVIGMDFTTVQWESKGGMMINFKVMAILVPQLRADKNSRCGILHATAA